MDFTNIARYTMNDVCCDENNISQEQIAMKYATTRSSPAKPDTASKRWCISIFIIVIGLPALLFFLATGGLFTLAGPFVILMGIQTLRKRPGWQVLGIITGGCFLFLGAAILLLPVHAAFSNAMSGIAVLLLGFGYLATTLFVMRKKF
jgi:hypothetical protein